MTDRPKTQSRSQRIGTKGERLFALWATDVGLTANKTEEDFGIDYFCQVFDERGAVVGSMLAVQVRAIESFARKRITLDRSDMISVAQIEYPFCLIGVDLQGARVAFRFLDADMLCDLHEALQTGQGSWSIRFKDLEHGNAQFRERLKGVTKLAYQNRLRVLRAQQSIALNFPGSRINVQQSADGGVAVVDVPWLTSVFEIDSGRREEVLRHILDEGNLPDIRTPGLALRPGLTPAYRLSDAPGIFVGGQFEAPDMFHLVDSDGEINVEAVNREMDGDFCVAARSGLVIRFGRGSLGEDGQWQHRISFHLSGKGHPLCDSNDLAFLRRLKPGARLRYGVGFELELWDPINRIGETIEALELVCSAANLDLSQFKLADLDDPEFSMSVMVLDGIARGAELQTYVSGFVLGPAAANDIRPHQPSWYEVPVVANLKDIGVVAWCRGRCLVSLHDGVICGFQPTSQISVHWGTRDRLPTGGRPQIWVADHWPSLDVLDAFDLEHRVIEPAAHPFGGMIWLNPHGIGDCRPPREWENPPPAGRLGVDRGADLPDAV